MSTEKLQVDWTRPIKTKCGLPARVLATDLKGPYPIGVAVESSKNEEMLCRCCKDGTGYARYDIVNVPRRVGGWWNYYSTSRGLVGPYESRSAAEQAQRTEELVTAVWLEFDVP